jgi:hypothetical protein
MHPGEVKMAEALILFGWWRREDSNPQDMFQSRLSCSVSSTFIPRVAEEHQ